MIGRIKAGGGNKINGIIEEYQVASGENISAGDFVSFVNSYETDTTIVNDGYYEGSVISAVKLNENKVFVAHSRSTSSGSNTGNKYLYGIVIEINGTTIIAGTDTEISNSSYSGNYISAVALSENKVFIAHSYDDSYIYLRGIVCEINGTTITNGSATYICTDKYSGLSMSATKLTENKVVITHRYNNNSTYLKAIVCIINGTTITAGENTTLDNTSYTGELTSVVALTENKIFVAYRHVGDLYSIIATIENTTITAGTPTLLSYGISGDTPKCISAVALSENKVFVVTAYNSSNTANYLSGLEGIVCEINGTTITTGNSTIINRAQIKYTYYSISATKLSENKVFVVYCFEDKMVLMIISILENNIIVVDDTNTNILLKGSWQYCISAVTLKANKICILHNNSNSYYDLNGIVSQIKIQKPIKEVAGIAQQNGTSGNNVKVAIPDI